MLKLEKRQTYFRHSVLNKERHVEVETKKVTLGTRALRARVESNLTAEEKKVRNDIFPLFSFFPLFTLWSSNGSGTQGINSWAILLREWFNKEVLFW